jgi:indolepyruvate ferredoxin oxidoreductase
LAFGGWFTLVFGMLARSRGLRGTPFDLFGKTQVRRIERHLPWEYMGHVDAGLDRLTLATADTVLEIARLPDLVRGYEEIKLAGVERFRERARELRGRLEDREPR